MTIEEQLAKALFEIKACVSHPSWQNLVEFYPALAVHEDMYNAVAHMEDTVKEFASVTELKYEEYREVFRRLDLEVPE